MVKKFPTNTSKETKTATNRITREAVLEMADDANTVAVKLAANKPFSPKSRTLDNVFDNVFHQQGYQLQYVYANVILKNNNN